MVVAAVARRRAGDFPRSGERGYEENTEVILPAILRYAYYAIYNAFNKYARKENAMTGSS